MRRSPSEEQEAVITNPQGHRIRLVSAVPGSGKTWVVARAIEHEVHSRPDAHPGVAALSFTNVAKKEVLEALGGTVGGRHFVGTLDSFLFKYVVRVFLPSIAKRKVVFKLMPNTMAALVKADVFFHDIWREVVDKDGEKKRKIIAKVNIFLCTRTIRGVVAPRPNGSGYLDLTSSESNAIVKKKRDALRNFGLMSHSDAAFVAANLLEGKHGQVVRDFVLSRFPFLVVDELQDTGESHGRCLRSLLSDPRCTALLVGDPDQSIYEFSGASPEMFARFRELPGVMELDLPVSRRCPEAVCRVATSLSSTGRTVRPLDTASVGQALMLVRASEDQKAEFLEGLPRNARVLARKNATVRNLIGNKTPVTPNFRSKPIAALYLAIHAMSRGEVRAALDAVGGAITAVAYGISSPLTREQLLKRGMTRHKLRALSMSVLLEVLPTHNESLKDWGERARTAFLGKIGDLPNNAAKGRRVNRPSKKLKGSWSRASTTTIHALSRPFTERRERHTTRRYTMSRKGARRLVHRFSGGQMERSDASHSSRHREREIRLFCVSTKTPMSVF
jgi:hypothetical protein